MSYNKLKALEGNIEAISTALAIHEERRNATTAERETLSKFTGCGGIKEVLSIGTGTPIPDTMQEAVKRLLSVLSKAAKGNETLYRQLLQSLKSSVLTAFYTPTFLIQAVAKQIKDTFTANDLKMGTFLEPSAGIGGFLPVGDMATHRTAFEKDLLTGLVLSALHPDTQVFIEGFETIDSQETEHNRFDVIASNIPFGDFRVFDNTFSKKGGIYAQASKTIHNYFFVKAVEKLNEGGILAFVTSRGIADTQGNQFVRDYLVHRCNLITALRLPDSLFMQTSGIEVGSDLLIFQKSGRKVTLTDREKLFMETTREIVPGSDQYTGHANKLFTLPKTALFTESRIQTNQYGEYVRKYRWQGEEADLQQTLSSMLKADFERFFRKNLLATPNKGIGGIQMSLFDCFNTNKAAQPNREKRTYTGTLHKWMKNGTLVLFENQLGTLRYKQANCFSDTTVTFVPLKVSRINIERANDYLPIREAYFELTTKESEELAEYPKLREQLNRHYDAYVRKWGFFHHNDNKEFFSWDSLGMEVFTIEMQLGKDICKADIMHEPVAFKKIDTSIQLTPVEALASSLNYYGSVNMDYLVQTTGQTETELTEALAGEIFYNPLTDCWENKGKFLAGNVVEKCKEICTVLADLTGNAQKWAATSVEALEDATPELIPYEELDFNMGERWIPASIYASFAKDLFGVNTTVMYFDVNDTYIVSLQGHSPIAYNVYSIGSYNGEALFVHALHDTVPEITKEIMRNGESIRVPDEEAIQAASTKIQEIRHKFNEWLDCQPIAVRDELVRLYNERFNCYVRPHYDGSVQTFPNLSFEQFPYDDLYPSQKDAIWMIKQNGGGVCWHAVGAGKTMVMCVAAYEMKRLGMTQKPLIIGLKANVHEIADCFRKAYPTAKLLYPGKEDFTPANRQELFSKIKNNNWDCIILTHDQFSKIPQSEQTMLEICEQELQDVERSLEVLEDSGMADNNKRLQKGLEKRQKNLNANLEALKEKLGEKKDDCVDFHAMGIDHIFVDESHYFKNLMFQTRHTRVAGIGNTQGSQRAMNLLVAIRDIQQRTGRDLGATFLSGTVVVNALTELYVLFKYLRPKELSRQCISCFDAWAAIFTKKTTDYELNITGSIKRKERFRTYIKIPELATFLREITDYRTAEMINLDVPQKNVRFLSDKPTIAQEEMIGRLVSFAGSGNWDDLGLDIPQPDNLDMAKMLVATNVARKMALDMRLLGDKFADDPGNKASRCAATIYDYYVRSKSNKGTQFVFSDLSTYKSNEWNIYQDIKDKLVTMGIPANEIRFIQTAKTEQERKKLFTDMNNGTVRVLFGSTSMLGTGVNAQQRAVAVHHLEVPWRPADLEQRNGRAVRKGNTVKFWGGNVVDIIIYGTEKTLDAYKFNLLRNKQLFINQINNGTIAVRRIDEDSMDENTGMNFAEFVAVLSGNMDLLNKAKLDNRIMQLEKEQAIFNKERYRAERKIAKTEQDIEEAMLTKQRMSEDWAYYKEYKGERKTLLLNLQQAIAEETGRELHKIAKTYRSEAIGTVGSYIGLNLSVRSEYHYTGAFERNIFLVEGKSGLKYKCGLSGALPLGFADSAVYPQATLDKLPELIRRQQEKIDQLANELTTLQQIFSRKWGKTAELDALKQECKELQRKIDNSLKELEQQPAVTVIAA